MIRPGAITPMFVILQNDDTDRHGSVTVDLLKSDITIGTAVRSVPLPPQSRKSVFLYLPASPTQPDQVRVRYLNESKSVVSETTEAVKSLPPDLPVFAIIGPTPPGLPPATDEQGQARTTRVFLTQDQIPDQWEGLQSFDAIFFSEALPRPLDAAQLNALKDWVLRGGVWVIAADEKTDGLMALASSDMLPLSPRALELADLDLFGPSVEVMTGTLERASALVTSNGLALVARRNLGLGCVVCTMVSFDAPAVSHWQGWSAVWQEVLAHLGVVPGEAPPVDVPLQMPEQRANALIAAVQPDSKPASRVVLVVLLAALYAVAVGPLDHSFVKFLKRPYMTWITFPTIVAVFTASSWLGAKYLVGGELSVRIVQRTMYAPAAAAAVTCRLNSLFAPATGTYVVSDGTEGLLQPLQPYSEYWILDSAGTFDNSVPATVDRIPIWNDRAYLSSSTSHDACPVTVRMVREDGVGSVLIANKGAYPLGNCWVCYGDRAWNVAGSLAPGSETQVILNDASSRSFPADLPAESFARMGSPDDRVAALQPLFREMNVRPALERGGLILVAIANSRATGSLHVNGATLEAPCLKRLEVVVYPDQDMQ